MKLKIGDKVKVIAGKDKGKEGKIIKTLKNKDKVIVEKINVVKKHLKPQGNDKTGSIIDMESAIHVSNVMAIDSKTNKVTRKKQIKEKEVVKKPKATKEVKETKEKKAKAKVAKKTTKKAE